MELGAVLEAVEGRGSAEAVELVLARYNEENRTIFRFDAADEDKRKVKYCLGREQAVYNSDTYKIGKTERSKLWLDYRNWVYRTAKIVLL